MDWIKNIRKDWALAAFVLLATFAVFSPALKNDFVNWDDDINVTENANVAQLNGTSLKNMFTETVSGSYTPLTTLSFAIENKIFGMKAAVFHLNNLLLHLICTLLVFIFLRSLGASLFVSFVATLLFGIHPMRVESVAWVTERKDVLYGAFYLLSMIFYLRYRKSRKQLFFFLTLAAFVLALLSKIQAVSLPLSLILIDYYLDNKFSLKQVISKIPFFLLSLVVGLLGVYLLSRQGSLETNEAMPFLQRIFIGTYSLCVYLIKSYWPYEMSAIYPDPEKINAVFYGSALALIALALLIYKYGRDRKEVVFGTLFFLVNIIFMLQIVGAGQAFLADRFTYIAYIGLFFLLAWALEFLFSGKTKTAVVVCSILYFAALGIVTWNRTQVWKNSETLFTDVIRKYPDASMAHNNLGIYYRDHQQDDRAVESYTRAIETNPQGYRSYTNRGEVYFEKGQTDKALTDMNMALKIKPGYSKALNNRAAIWGSMKKFNLAIDDLNKAISQDPGNLKALSNRSLAWYSMGKFDKASEDATSYLKLKPDDVDMLNQRGLCFDQMNRNQEALDDFTRAIQLRPASGIFVQNRSYVLAKTGDFKGALRDILKARDLGVKVNEAYVKMLQSR